MDIDQKFDSHDLLWIELTNFCNLECGHCYNNSSPTEPLAGALSNNDYATIIRDAAGLGFKRIQFIGGEPMFYPHLQDLVAIALGFPGLEVEIFSNLTLLPDWLFDPEYTRVDLACSFYSTNPATHDVITSRVGSFERTVRNINRVSAAGRTMRVGFIETPHNTGEYDSVRAYFAERGITDVGFDRVRGFGRAEAAKTPELSELCGNCSKGSLNIAVDGSVSGCIMSKAWSFGNIKERSVANLYRSRERAAFARELERIGGETDELPRMCQPYYRGDCAPQCAPSCGPQSGPCNPCSPFGAQPCNPNGRCGPF